jgi:hypothetical protein
MHSSLRLLVLMLACALLSSPVLASGDDPALSFNTSRIEGKIAGADGRPAQAVQVHVYHLFSQQLYSSQPTDSAGKYEIVDLPKGYFDVAVQTARGLYVADHVVNVPAGGKAVLTLQLNAAETSGSSEDKLRYFPGLDDAPVGTATIKDKAPGGFLRGKTGMALLAGGGAVALMALGGSSGGGSSGDASPSEP